MVRNSEDFIKGDEIFHFDWPVREDEAFELDAKGAWQLAEKLFVSGSHIPSVVLIVVDSTFVEVAVEALLQSLAPVPRNLQVQDEERLVRDGD